MSHPLDRAVFNALTGRLSAFATSDSDARAVRIDPEVGVFLAAADASAESRDHLTELARRHPGAGLIVQVRVVGEPEHGGPGVGGDVLGVLVGAEEQGFDDGRGHHRLAGPGGRCQGELGQDAVVLVVLPGPMQPVQDLLDSLGLVVLEGVTHGGQALRLIWKLCR